MKQRKCETCPASKWCWCFRYCGRKLAQEMEETNRQKALHLMNTNLCLRALANANCDNPAFVVAKLFYDLGWWKPEASGSADPRPRAQGVFPLRIHTS
jgi:hypothetical protein